MPDSGEAGVIPALSRNCKFPPLITGTSQVARPGMFAHSRGKEVEDGFPDCLFNLPSHRLGIFVGLWRSNRRDKKSVYPRLRPVNSIKKTLT
jgi:hypothetical protein